MLTTFQCDENKPECSNCRRRQVRCDYTTAGTRPSEGTNEPYATLENHQALNVPDLELMYYWTTSTSQTVSAMGVGSVSWQCDTTELGLAHTHILHLIFAFTALHLTRCRPGRSMEYEGLADKHYSLALSSVTNQLASINPENCDAVYISVQLICFVCWARGPQPDEYLAFGKSGRSEWLLMFRGVRSTIETLGAEHFTKSHAPRVRAKGPPLNIEAPPQYEQRLKDLREHVSHLTPAGRDLDDDLNAVDVLTHCYQSRYGGRDGEYHVVFAWLYRMPESFLDRMQRHDACPLIIYAYFVVLMGEMERFWYMKGWTHHVMGGIWDILADEHRVWMRWPMAQVGWIPP